MKKDRKQDWHIEHLGGQVRLVVPMIAATATKHGIVSVSEFVELTWEQISALRAACEPTAKVEDEINDRSHVLQNATEATG